MAQHTKTTKDDIAREAYRLFLENGYTATTYRDIAHAVGRDRALVQYHFPHKEELVVGCLRKLIDLIEVEIARNELAVPESAGYRVLIAQLYFAFLLQPGIRRFTLDVLSSRAITHEILVMESNWNLDYLGVPPAEQREAFDQAIVAVGGAYELMYRYLITGEELDVRRLAAETIANSAPGPRSTSVEGHGTGIARELTDLELKAFAQLLLDGFRPRDAATATSSHALRS
jgi:AcrR family transcriptional regulator